jgi:phospholipase A1/A2
MMEGSILRRYMFCFLCLILPSLLVAQPNNDSIADIVKKQSEWLDLFRPQTIKSSEKEALEAMDRTPAFAAYKDNFFITGVPLNKKITGSSADALFQVSIRQRLTKTVLPFKTFAYLTYTQKSFWNIYSESSPFRDMNYNPGIGLAKIFISKGLLFGSGAIQIMHESNGQYGENSRSWNYLSLTAKYYINLNLNISGEFWIPYIDSQGNKDLLDYKGLGRININSIDNTQKWWFELQLNPRKGWGNINTTASISFKVSSSSNQYIFLCLQDGYAESLLDYNKYSMNLRVGICIKPDFYNIY